MGNREIPPIDVICNTAIVYYYILLQEKKVLVSPVCERVELNLSLFSMPYTLSAYRNIYVSALQFFLHEHKIICT